MSQLCDNIEEGCSNHRKQYDHLARSLARNGLAFWKKKGDWGRVSNKCLVDVKLTYSAGKRCR